MPQNALGPGRETLVSEVKAFMKLRKISQVCVGHEARMSQAVVSQWLSGKYHGNVSKESKSPLLWVNALTPHRSAG